MEVGTGQTPQKHIAFSYASHANRTQERVLKQIVSFYQYKGGLLDDQDEFYYTYAEYLLLSRIIFNINNFLWHIQIYTMKLE